MAYKDINYTEQLVYTSLHLTVMGVGVDDL